MDISIYLYIYKRVRASVWLPPPPHPPTPPLQLTTTTPPIPPPRPKTKTRHEQFIQQATDPNTMRAMLQMQQMGLLPPTPMGTGATPAQAQGGMPDFSALLGGGDMAGGAPVVPPMPPGVGVPVAPVVADPATRFAPQLQQLEDMGFGDRDRNLQVGAMGGWLDGRGGGGGGRPCALFFKVLIQIRAFVRSHGRRWRPRVGTSTRPLSGSSLLKPPLSCGGGREGGSTHG